LTPLEILLARIEEIRSEIEGLHSQEDALTEDQETRFAELGTEFDTLDAQRLVLVEREERVASIRSAATDPRNVVSGAGDDDPYGSDGVRDAEGSDPWDMDVIAAAPRSELRARALSAIEQASGFRPQDQTVLTRWVDEMDEASEEGARLARHILVTSSPEYRRQWISAFRIAARGGTPDTRYLTRAMSLTDAAGGYAVPQDLDPALILTSDGTTNPFRQISRVVQTLGDTWTGLSTGHAAWSNDGEVAEVSDDATTFASPSIAVHKAQVFVPFSIEIGMDYPGFTQDLRLVIAAGKDDLDAANFATGTGSDQPTGIVTALTGGSSEVASAGADVFAIADVYALEEALPAKYRRRGQWAANKSIYNDVRQFDTTGGSAMWERIGAGQPSELVGYSAHESSEMDGAIGAAAENYVLILGDWQNYVIVDRVGMTIELIPHLFATAANRPSGQRGFYGFARTGADSVNDGGFRMLNVT